MVESDSMSAFKKFLVFWNQWLEPHNNVPEQFSLSHQKFFEIMVGFWSRAISLSDFKNFWFVEISGSSRTTMSPSTFLYLVKNFSKLWSDFGWGRYHFRILKIFVFFFFELSGSSRTTMSPGILSNKISKFWSDFVRGRYHCTKPLFSISLFKKSSALTIDRNVWFKRLLIFRYGSPILNIFGFLK